MDDGRIKDIKAELEKHNMPTLFSYRYAFKLGHDYAIRQHIPEDKASKIDEVIVKIWNMSKGDINDEACVRKATLEWAQGELRQLSPKVKLPEERNERTFWGGHNSYARGHNQALQQAKEALKDTLRQVMEMVERKQKDNPYIVISDLRDGYDRGLQTIKQALQQAIEEKE